MFTPLALSVLLFGTNYLYEYEDEEYFSSLLKATCTISTVQVVVAYDGGVQALNSADVSLAFQNLLSTNGFPTSAVVPAVAPTSTVHTPTAHTVHAPPTPHVPPATPHAPSSHSMDMGMDMDMAMGGTVHEAMAPPPDAMAMGMDDMDVAHQASAHAMGMKSAKAAFTSDLTLTLASSTCPPDLSTLNSAANRASLARSLGPGVTVTSITAGTSTCVDCSTVPAVSNSCPTTRNLAFCQDVANTLICLNQSCAVQADSTPDTDPTCAYDLNTLDGINSYFTAICSPATV
eukprot:c7916_g1_i1.p1 GENE.c7916_g1_i1~~c7916_g1_i1.p1  ORF type:complete len:289 (+),score=73.33 c7916_g1_i1:34-900(+)